MSGSSGSLMISKPVSPLAISRSLSTKELLLPEFRLVPPNAVNSTPFYVVFRVLTPFGLPKTRGFYAKAVVLSTGISINVHWN